MTKKLLINSPTGQLFDFSASDLFLLPFRLQEELVWDENAKFHRA